MEEAESSFGVEIGGGGSGEGVEHGIDIMRGQEGDERSTLRILER